MPCVKIGEIFDDPWFGWHSFVLTWLLEICLQYSKRLHFYASKIVGCNLKHKIVGDPFKVKKEEKETLENH